jgi:hypothetical protein
MHSLKPLKSLAAGAVVGMALVASAPAHAAIADGNTAGGSNLLLFVWDGTKSLVQDLGSTFSQDTIANLAGSSAVNLSFNVDLTGFDLANTKWEIAAVSGNGGAASNANSLIATGSSTPSTGTGAGQTSGANLGTNVGTINAFIRALNNSGLAGPAYVATSGPIFWDGGVTFNQYFGGGAYDFSGAIGSTLNFYSLVNTPSGRSNTQTYTQYAGALGTGTWTLGTTGNLVYSYGNTAVPLPAAGWLLVSGLMGLGAASRRRRAAV